MSIPPSNPAPLPYASATPLAAEGNLFRKGSLLVARDGMELPNRCILCGDAGFRKPIPLTFTWDSSFTITRQNTLQLRRKMVIKAYLCQMHRARWATGRMLGGIGIAASGALLTAGIITGIFSESSDVPVYTPLGITMMLSGFAALTIAMFYFTLRTRTMFCRRIEAGYIHLEGVSEKFLADLPVLPEIANPAP